MSDSDKFERPRELPIFAWNSHIASIVIVGGFILLGALLTMSIGMSAWALLVAAMFAAMIIGHARQLLMCYLVWVSVQPALGSVISSPAMQLGDEFFVCLITMVAGGTYIIDKYKPLSLTWFFRTVAALLAICAISTFINHAPPMPAVHFVISYLGFIPCFYIAHRTYRNSNGRFVIRAVWMLLALQLVCNLAWLAGINPLPNRSLGSVDFAIGTLGGNPLVAYLCLAVLLLATPLFLNLRAQRSAAFFALLALVQLYLTYAYHAYLLLCTTLVFQAVIILRKPAYVLTMIAAFSLILFVGSRDFGHLSGGEDARTYFNPAYLQERWEAMYHGSKGATYRAILIKAPSDMPAPILGAGPGNFASSIGARYGSRLAVRYIYEYYMSISGRTEMIGGSITQQVLVGVLGLWSEIGPIGFILFFGLHAYAVARVWRQLRRGLYVDPYKKTLAQAFVPLALVYLGINFLADFFQFDFLQLGIWLWAAVIWEADAPPAPRQKEVSKISQVRTVPRVRSGAMA